MSDATITTTLESFTPLWIEVVGPNVRPCLLNLERASSISLFEDRDGKVELCIWDGSNQLESVHGEAARATWRAIRQRLGLGVDEVAP